MEVCVGCARTAQLGPCGSDQTCTPDEEDGIEDHDEEQRPNSEDEKCHIIADVTLLFTVVRA